VWLDGDDICYRAAKGVLTSELRESLARNRLELIEVLNGRMRLEPASFSQQRLWFLDQLEPESSSYTMPLALRCHGAIRVDYIEQSLNLVVQRHEVLRTTFKLVHGEPYQVIHADMPLSVARHDLTHLPAPDRLSRAMAEAEELARLPFDLKKGPLLRAAVWILAEDDVVFMIPMHHSISDGWSLGVIVYEMGLAYNALLAETQPANLSKLDSFALHARWERDWIGQQAYRDQLEFWKGRLAHPLPLLALPTDRPRPAKLSYRGALFQFSIDADLSERLRGYSRSHGLTPFMAMLSAYFVLLHRYSGQADLLVGTPVAARTRAETRKAVGFYANTLVLRAHLNEQISMPDLLKQVKRLTLEAIENQGVPFEKLVEEMHPERNSSHAPVFQTMFVFQTTPFAKTMFQGFKADPMLIDSGMTKFDITLSVSDFNSAFDCAVEYSTELYDESTIATMMRHYQTLLSSMIDMPEAAIFELPMLDAVEIQRQLVEWNRTKSSKSSARCAHTIFEEQAMRYPDAPAIFFEDSVLTYSDLNLRSNRLARCLQSKGIGVESLVGIILDRSPEFIIALLAVLKAGAAYLPLDPDYPAERLSFMMGDAQPTALITTANYASRFTLDSERLVIVEQTDTREYDESNLNTNVEPANLAYVIYTSGSTGQPKGTLLEHKGLSNLIDVMCDAFGGGPGRRILQFCSISFDASVWEIFMALGTGGALVVAPGDVLASGPSLVRLLAEKEVTTLSIPPSVLRAIPYANLPKLDTLITGGEACTLELVKTWGKGRRFFNCYGPTETTVCATMHECDPASVHSPPIGHPVANTTAYILDKNLRVLPVGAAGELCVGGTQVARGYLDRPELTASRFVRDPFRPDGGTIYRTGDLARYRQDGLIEFLGRADRQVKIRGFRIELGEVEQTISTHPAVKDAVVHVLNGRTEDKRLVAYIVPRPQFVPGELSEYLRGKLPSHMVPSSFVELDALPLTSNGKVDRTLLPEPCLAAPATNRIAPRNAVESEIAAIWKEVLEIDEIGVLDNFFEIGGHSLLAMRLLSRLHEAFGIEVPLRRFFEMPTIEGVEKIIAQTRGNGKVNGTPASHAADDSLVNTEPAKHLQSLVPIQPRGDRTPLFLAAPAGGVVFPYYHLAPNLGDSQPLYALQDPGLDEHHVQFETVEELAAHYVSAMKTIQPDGPYMLGGWSFGGTVAFEMAQQLSRDGDRVSLLLMLDTQGTDLRPPAKRRILKTFTALAGHLYDGLRLLPGTMPYVWEGLYWIARNSVRSGTDRERFKVVDYIRWMWTDLLMKQAGIPTELSGDSAMALMRLPTFRRVIQTLRANGQTLFKYEPKAYPGKIVLFRATEQPPMRKSAKSRTLDWDRYAMEGVEVYDIETNHVALMKSPAIEQVVKALQGCIARAHHSA
jgi:surfactin family lipopeptide synthetase A